MFNEWAKVVEELNSNRNDSTIEEAKKIREKYLIKGRLLKILGIICIIAVLASFITFSIVELGDGINIIIVVVSSLLFPPSAAIIGFGATYSRLGAKIEFVLSQPPLIQKDDNKCCPNCGDVISIGELFCSKCGTKLDNTCPKCGFVNDLKNNFCSKCGAQLKD